MTKETNYKTKISFIGDGENREFNFYFRIYEKSDVNVYVDSLLVTEGFFVSFSEKGGGSVTFENAPQVNSLITLIRNLPIKRTTDFQEGGPFRASRVNGEFDYQVACLEEIEEKLSRVIYKPPYLIDDSNLSLPEPIAGRTLIWSEDNTGLKNSKYDVDELENQLSEAVESVTQMRSDVSEKHREISIASQYIIPNSHTLGEIFTDGFVELLDGQGWCRGDILPSFAYSGLVAEFNKYSADNTKGIAHIDFATYEASLLSNKGNCILFGYDNVNNLIRLPTIQNGVILAQAKDAGENNKWYNDQMQGHSHAVNAGTSGGGSIRQLGYQTAKVAGIDNASLVWIEDFSGTPIISGPIKNKYDVGGTPRIGDKTMNEQLRRRFKVQLANVGVQASESQYANFVDGLTNKANKNASNLTSAEAKTFNKKLGLNPQYISPEFYYNTLGAVISYDAGIKDLTDVERMSLRTSVVAICKTANNGYEVGDVICNPTIGKTGVWAQKADAILMQNGNIWTEITNELVIFLRPKGSNVHSSALTNSTSNLWAFRMVVY